MTYTCMQGMPIVARLTMANEIIGLFPITRSGQEILAYPGTFGAFGLTNVNQLINIVNCLDVCVRCDIPDVSKQNKLLFNISVAVEV